jgi:hypothetical protein
LKQDVFVKLFFARYFDVTPEHMAVAIGMKMHEYYYHSFVNQAIGTDAVDAAVQSDFKVKKARLSKLWWALRRQTFGKTSYLSTLVQHIVELHDFQATVFNLARDEKILRFDSPDETEEQKTARLMDQEVYKQAKAKHIARLKTSMSAAVQKAQQQLDELQTNRGRSASENAVKHAQAALRHYQQEESREWTPDILETYPSKQDVPSERRTYAHMDDTTKQTFWESKWSLEIGTAMLWEVRHVVNISATLRNNEEFYMAAFLTFAADTWRLRTAENARVNETPRAANFEEALQPQIYANLAGVNAHYFDDLAGLDLLRLPRTSGAQPGRKKRPAATFQNGFVLGKKRKSWGSSLGYGLWYYPASKLRSWR